MTPTTCEVCEARPTPPGTAICATCVANGRRDLWQIASLRPHLDSKRARETARTYDGPSRAADTPLPFDPRVTLVATAVTNTINDALDTLAKRCTEPPLTGPAHETLWLRARLTTLAGIDGAARHFHDFAHARNALTVLFDRPPDSLYLGPCDTPDDDTGTPCTASLYVESTHGGTPTAAQLACPACGATHDVDARRRWLLEATEDHLATMPELSALFAGIMSRRTLYRLAEKGFLRPRTIVLRDEGRTATAYRVGDVGPAQRAADEAARAARRKRAKP